MQAIQIEADAASRELHAGDRAGGFDIVFRGGVADMGGIDEQEGKSMVAREGLEAPAGIGNAVHFKVRIRKEGDS